MLHVPTPVANSDLPVGRCEMQAASAWLPSSRHTSQSARSQLDIIPCAPFIRRKAHTQRKLQTTSSTYIYLLALHNFALQLALRRVALWLNFCKVYILLHSLA